MQSVTNTKTSPASVINVADVLGYAAPFNKRTFVPDLDVKSIDVPADNAYGGGWAFEAVLSKARCRRFPRTASRVSQSCRCAVTTRCLSKRSIACNMLLAVRCAAAQEVDMVARDFSGARWRRKPGPAQQFDSILEVAFKKTPGSPCHPAPHQGSWWYPKRMDRCMWICQAT